MNPTTDPTLRSWLPIAEDSPFAIQNLPYGVLDAPGRNAHAGVAIGEHILDLTAMAAEGGLAGSGVEQTNVFAGGNLNAFLALGRSAWGQVRRHLSGLLRADEPRLRDDARLRERVLLPQREARMRMPVHVGDYTDFYSSKEHATNVGTMLRGPDTALMPNWLYLPVAYHGRASSVVVSGTDVPRPHGQYRPDPAQPPVFGPTRALDYELEMGAIVGSGNPLGKPIAIGEAEGHLFGLVLVNDWSARDIQGWEYQPLGPFLAKNFATSISPWIVPMEALEPFRCPGPAQDPEPLPYLRQPGPGAFDIRLEVTLQTGQMTAGEVVCASNFRYLYWTLAQQVAHHTVNGCPLVPGDLLASGTISGATPESRACLLERTWRGSQPLTLSSGETRRFLEDGDRVSMTAWCQGAGYRVGFGDVTGTVLPAGPVG